VKLLFWLSLDTVAVACYRAAMNVNVSFRSGRHSLMSDVQSWYLDSFGNVEVVTRFGSRVHVPKGALEMVEFFDGPSDD